MKKICLALILLLLFTQYAFDKRKSKNNPAYEKKYYYFKAIDIYKFTDMIYGNPYGDDRDYRESVTFLFIIGELPDGRRISLSAGFVRASTGYGSICKEYNEQCRFELGHGLFIDNRFINSESWLKLGFSPGWYRIYTYIKDKEIPERKAESKYKPPEWCKALEKKYGVTIFNIFSYEDENEKTEWCTEKDANREECQLVHVKSGAPACIKNLVGKWKLYRAVLDKYIRLEFRQNGTYEQDLYGTIIKGTWRINGNKLIMREVERGGKKVNTVSADTINICSEDTIILETDKGKRVTWDRDRE